MTRFSLTINHKVCFSALLILGFGLFNSAKGQDESTNQVFEQVLNILTIEEVVLPENQAELLQKSAWEALTYLQEGKENYNREDLLEAVPDYYNFKIGTAIIKLIDVNDYNVYGIEVEVSYKLEKGSIMLMNENGRVKDTWRILYLDKNYMAMDMGELRVFFTKTPIQE